MGLIFLVMLTWFIVNIGAAVMLAGIGGWLSILMAILLLLFCVVITSALMMSIVLSSGGSRKKKETEIEQPKVQLYKEEIK